MGVSMNGGTPLAGWFILENPNLKWMMAGGTILEKLHMETCWDLHHGGFPLVSQIAHHENPWNMISVISYETISVGKSQNSSGPLLS